MYASQRSNFKHEKMHKSSATQSLLLERKISAQRMMDHDGDKTGIPVHTIKWHLRKMDILKENNRLFDALQRTSNAKPGLARLEREKGFESSLRIKSNLYLGPKKKNKLLNYIEYPTPANSIGCNDQCNILNEKDDEKVKVRINMEYQPQWPSIQARFDQFMALPPSNLPPAPVANCQPKQPLRIKITSTATPLPGARGNYDLLSKQHRLGHTPAVSLNPSTPWREWMQQLASNSQQCNCPDADENGKGSPPLMEVLLPLPHYILPTSVAALSACTATADLSSSVLYPSSLSSMANELPTPRPTTRAKGDKDKRRLLAKIHEQKLAVGRWLLRADCVLFEGRAGDGKEVAPEKEEREDEVETLAVRESVLTSFDIDWLFASFPVCASSLEPCSVMAVLKQLNSRLKRASSSSSSSSIQYYTSALQLIAACCAECHLRLQGARHWLSMDERGKMLFNNEMNGRQGTWWMEELQMIAPVSFYQTKTRRMDTTNANNEEEADCHRRALLWLEGCYFSRIRQEYDLHAILSDPLSIYRPLQRLQGAPHPSAFPASLNGEGVAAVVEGADDDEADGTDGGGAGTMCNVCDEQLIAVTCTDCDMGMCVVCDQNVHAARGTSHYKDHRRQPASAFASAGTASWEDVQDDINKRKCLPPSLDCLARRYEEVVEVGGQDFLLPHTQLGKKRGSRSSPSLLAWVSLGLIRDLLTALNFAQRPQLGLLLQELDLRSIRVHGAQHLLEVVKSDWARVDGDMWSIYERGLKQATEETMQFLLDDEGGSLLTAGLKYELKEEKEVLLGVQDSPPWMHLLCDAAGMCHCQQGLSLQRGSAAENIDDVYEGSGWKGRGDWVGRTIFSRTRQGSSRGGSTHHLPTSNWQQDLSPYDLALSSFCPVDCAGGGESLVSPPYFHLLSLYWEKQAFSSKTLLAEGITHEAGRVAKERAALYEYRTNEAFLAVTNTLQKLRRVGIHGFEANQAPAGGREDEEGAEKEGKVWEREIKEEADALLCELQVRLSAYPLEDPTFVSLVPTPLSATNASSSSPPSSPCFPSECLAPSSSRLDYLLPFRESFLLQSPSFSKANASSFLSDAVHPLCLRAPSIVPSFLNTQPSVSTLLHYLHTLSLMPQRHIHTLHGATSLPRTTGLLIAMLDKMHRAIIRQRTATYRLFLAQQRQEVLQFLNDAGRCSLFRSAQRNLQDIFSHNNRTTPLSSPRSPLFVKKRLLFGAVDDSSRPSTPACFPSVATIVSATDKLMPATASALPTATPRGEGAQRGQARKAIGFSDVSAVCLALERGGVRVTHVLDFLVYLQQNEGTIVAALHNKQISPVESEEIQEEDVVHMRQKERLARDQEERRKRFGMDEQIVSISQLIQCGFSLLESVHAQRRARQPESILASYSSLAAMVAQLPCLATLQREAPRSLRELRRVARACWGGECFPPLVGGNEVQVIVTGLNRGGEFFSSWNRLVRACQAVSMRYEAYARADEEEKQEEENLEEEKKGNDVKQLDMTSVVRHNRRKVVLAALRYLVSPACSLLVTGGPQGGTQHIAVTTAISLWDDDENDLLANASNSKRLVQPLVFSSAVTMLDICLLSQWLERREADDQRKEDGGEECEHLSYTLMTPVAALAAGVGRASNAVQFLRSAFPLSSSSSSSSSTPRPFSASTTAASSTPSSFVSVCSRPSSARSDHSYHRLPGSPLSSSLSPPFASIGLLVAALTRRQQLNWFKTHRAPALPAVSFVPPPTTFGNLRSVFKANAEEHKRAVQRRRDDEAEQAKRNEEVDQRNKEEREKVSFLEEGGKDGTLFFLGGPPQDPTSLRIPVPLLSDSFPSEAEFSAGPNGRPTAQDVGTYGLAVNLSSFFNNNNNLNEDGFIPSSSHHPQGGRHPPRSMPSWAAAAERAVILIQKQARKWLAGRYYDRSLARAREQEKIELAAATATTSSGPPRISNTAQKPYYLSPGATASSLFDFDHFYATTKRNENTRRPLSAQGRAARNHLFLAERLQEGRKQEESRVKVARELDAAQRLVRSQQEERDFFLLMQEQRIREREEQEKRSASQLSTGTRIDRRGDYQYFVRASSPRPVPAVALPVSSPVSSAADPAAISLADTQEVVNMPPRSRAIQRLWQEGVPKWVISPSLLPADCHVVSDSEEEGEKQMPSSSSSPAVRLHAPSAPPGPPLYYRECGICRQEKATVYCHTCDLYLCSNGKEQNNLSDEAACDEEVDDEEETFNTGRSYLTLGRKQVRGRNSRNGRATPVQQRNRATTHLCEAKNCDAQLHASMRMQKHVRLPWI